MNKLITIFKALSDRNRLRIISALASKEELCACQATELIQVTPATASRHMGILISSGLVKSRKDGRWVYYHLNRDIPELNTLIKWIEAQLQNSSTAENDLKALENIISCEPEDICRKQRGDKCCPKT